MRVGTVEVLFVTVFLELSTVLTKSLRFRKYLSSKQKHECRTNECTAKPVTKPELAGSQRPEI